MGFETLVLRDVNEQRMGNLQATGDLGSRDVKALILCPTFLAAPDNLV